MSDPMITCPHCKSAIKLTESLAAPLIDATRKQYEQRLVDKDEAVAKREASVQQQLTEIAREREAIGAQIDARLGAERERIAGEESAKARRLVATDLKQRDQQLAELTQVLQQRDEKLAEAQKAQAELIRKERELDDAKRELDLTVEKQVQASLQTVRERAIRQARHYITAMQTDNDTSSVPPQLPPVPTDAERLMRGFGQAITESPSRIAPERAEELRLQVFGGKPCDLHFIDGPANFFAHVGTLEISASYAALLSVWGLSRASIELADSMTQAARQGSDRLETAPGTRGHEALRLVEAAKTLIRDPKATWPPALPMPDPDAAAGTPQGGINDLFLGTASWALLHEIGHLALKHEQTLPAKLRQAQEFEADGWATVWVLEKVPERQREFRVFCVATGLAWLGLVDQVRGQGSSHPPAAQRLLSAAAEFRTGELSPGIEMAGHMLKALFDPTADLGISDHPLEAFERLTLHLRRGP